MLQIGSASIPCRGLLIDFDGTLIDSESVILDLWLAIAHKHGVTLDPATTGRRIRGRMAVIFVKELFPQMNAAQHAKIVQEIISAEETAPYNLMPGAHAFLESAHKNNVPVVIVTSSWRAKVQHVLDRYKLVPLISTLVTSDEVTAKKPDPESYHLAIRKTGIAPEHLIAIEDSETGIASAVAAGLRCIGFGREASRDSTASFFAQNFEEIRIIR